MDRLAVLGGANLGVLKKVPLAQQRFVGMGLVFLSTASLAGLSMWFALSSGVKVPKLAAVPIALFWAAVVLGLDRFLTMQMASASTLWAKLWMAVPRLVIAAVIGVVVSQPLVLRIFSDDISASVQRQITATSGTNKATLAGTTEQKTVVALTAEIAALEKQARGEVPVQPTAAVARARSRVADLTQRRDTQQVIAGEAAKLFICELYGGNRATLKDPSKCSPKPGRNGPYQQIAADNKAQNDLLARLNADLAAAQRSLTVAETNATTTDRKAIDAIIASANSALPGKRADLKVAEAALALRTKELIESGARETGLLAQLRGLHTLGQENSTMRYAHYAVALLFIMIELLPVIAKLISSAGPLSAYDQIVRLIDEEATDKAQIRRLQQRAIEQGKSDNVQLAEQDMREHELEVAKASNVQVARQMQNVMNAALKAWGDEVAGRIRTFGRSSAANGAASVNGAGSTNGVGSPTATAAGSPRTSSWFGQKGVPGHGSPKPGMTHGGGAGFIKLGYEVPDRDLL
ncbi:DUF4407 domain-containing protein [Kribbella qitaiheensis]|nr:DUF4407 domain-containing protein [Kribbella qitaiheensis]